MIYCVWYPSGGFGHYINAVLSLYSDKFVRPTNTLEFSKNGNSHSVELVVSKYLHGCWSNSIEFIDSKNYSVLIDNGIHNESTNFRSVLPDAKIIKICYTDYSWPIIARTSIEKALTRTLEDELSIDFWNTDSPWAQREKYFLYLRDHHFRHAWKKHGLEDHVIYVDSMCAYATLFKDINSIVPTVSFEDNWQQWRAANDVYISPVEVSKKIVDLVKSNTLVELDHITDIWTQAVVYYFIQLEFGIEVPHNDYSNWFTNTIDIVKMLNKHGVDIDSN
jgi:hypothetical protein